MMRAEGPRKAHPTLAQLLEYQGKCRVVETKPAILLRNHDAEKSHLGHLVHELLRVDVFVFEVIDNGIDVAANEFAHEIRHLIAGLGGSKCHAYYPLNGFWR